MKKLAKNIPTYYTSKGTPIFRDTTALPFNNGGPVNPAGPVNILQPVLSESEMKAKIAYEAALGNSAAQRMLSLNPKTYDFGDGNFGTHYMASFGNYAVPTLQDTGKPDLEYIENPPPGKEDFKFSTPEQAEYFAENYKTVSPMMTRQYANGGPLHDRDINGKLLQSTYASALGNMFREGGPFGEDQGVFDYATSIYASQPGNYYRTGGQFPRPYSLPEDSFKQGGTNLHNSVYASSSAPYPGIYATGGVLGGPIIPAIATYNPTLPSTYAKDYTARLKDIKSNPIDPKTGAPYQGSGGTDAGSTGTGGNYRALNPQEKAAKIAELESLNINQLRPELLEQYLNLKNNKPYFVAAERSDKFMYEPYDLRTYTPMNAAQLAIAYPEPEPPKPTIGYATDPYTGKIVPGVSNVQNGATFQVNRQMSQFAEAAYNTPEATAKRAAIDSERLNNIELLKTMTPEQKAAMRAAGLTPAQYLADPFSAGATEFAEGGKLVIAGGEKHKIYKKTSPTGNGEGIEGHIMVNHPTMDKGQWDTIDLTTKAGAKTVADGIAATKQWHKENPNVYRDGGSVFYASNTPQLEGEGKDLTYPDGAYVYGRGGVIKTSHLFADGGPKKTITTVPTQEEVMFQQASTKAIPYADKTIDLPEITVTPGGYKGPTNLDPVLANALLNTPQVQQKIALAKGKGPTAQGAKAIKSSKAAQDRAKWERIFDERYYNQVQAKADWEKRSSGAAQPVDWFWTLPLAASSAGLNAAYGLGEALSGLMATELPGLAGTTVGQGLNAGFITKGILDAPSTVGAWQDVAAGKKDWKDAAEKTAWNLLDFTGVGETKAGLKLLGEDARAASNYLTTQTPLRNAYNYNPLAGRLGEYNRVVGQDAVDDIVESGLVRVNENAGVAQDLGPFGTVYRTTPYPSFGKAKPQQRYANQVISEGKTPYIISTDRPMRASTLGTHGKGTTQFPVDEAGKYMKGFPASEAKVYEFGEPHWLKGYKEVPITQNALEATKTSKNNPGIPLTDFITDAATFGDQLLGNVFRNKANKKAIEEGNQWLKQWIDNPVTQAKMLEDWRPYTQRIGNRYKDDYDLGLEQARTFVPNSKEYSLTKQLEELTRGKRNVHSDESGFNAGVSYLHYDTPYKRAGMINEVSGPRDNNSWISRSTLIPQNLRKSVTIHEGTHDWTSDFLLNNSNQTPDILNTLSPEVRKIQQEWKTLSRQGKDPSQVMGKSKSYLGYLANPTEVQARIMQLRNHFNLTPEASLNLTKKEAQQIMDDIKALPVRKRPINEKFFDVVDNDPEKLKYLFNRLWMAAPIVGGSYLGNELLQNNDSDQNSSGQFKMGGQARVIKSSQLFNR